MKKSNAIREKAQLIKGRKNLYKKLEKECFVSYEHVYQRWLNNVIEYKIPDKYHEKINEVLDRLILEGK